MVDLVLFAAESGGGTDNPLIKVVPGLMIWTLICFAITFFVLKRYAFGPIQKAIDSRRERIRQSIEEADRARDEARRLLEEHRALLGQARGQAEEILSEARRVADAVAALVDDPLHRAEREPAQDEERECERDERPDHQARDD